MVVKFMREQMTLNKDESKSFGDGILTKLLNEGRMCCINITKHFLQLLMNSSLHLRVGSQQVEGPVHGSRRGVMTLEKRNI